MNILEVKDLCKTYVVNKRQNNVLKNVSFSVAEGEMVAVMGPSGSGKSTLLYTVSGMDGATAGEVKFCGRNIADMAQKELADLRLNEMGFIFQQMYMLKNLTVLDNIILPAVQSHKINESRNYKHCYSDYGDNDFIIRFHICSPFPISSLFSQASQDHPLSSP